MAGSRLRKLPIVAAVAVLLPVIALITLRKSNPDHVISDARVSVDRVREFETLYPASYHFVSYWTGTYGDPTWNSEVGLYGRYVLTMQAPIDLNALRSRIDRFGSPRFVLSEIQSINIQIDGRIAYSTGSGSLAFGADEWAKLVKSHGDLSVLGLKPNTDHPIPGFERVLTKH